MVFFIKWPARKITENVISFINYISKKESIKLAKERGSFGAFYESKFMNDHNIISNFMEHESETVSFEMWEKLA